MRLDPAALAAAGLSGQDVYTAIRRRQRDRAAPGGFEGPDRRRDRSVSMASSTKAAGPCRPLVLKTVGQRRRGAAVRRGDASIDGVANARLAAWFGQQPAILLTVTKTADANVIDTVDKVNAVLPLLRSPGCRRTSSSPSCRTAPAPSAPVSTT